jgi:polyisoprenoid-binding protein YceI
LPVLLSQAGDRRHRLPEGELTQMSRLVKFAPALAALTFALTASAGAHKVDGKPKIQFKATATGNLPINGTGSNLSISEDGGKLVFKVSLKDLKTGIGMRDTHTQKYLETSKWPDASFSIPADKVKLPASKATATGQFRLHGVTKEKSVTYTAKKDGDGYKVDASFSVNILEHGIEEPCFTAVCMKPDVKVEVSFKTKG